MTKDTFYLYVRDAFFEKGDTLNSSGSEYIVIKTYRRTWWRKFIYYTLCIKIKMDSYSSSILKLKLIENGKN
jgi:hypothetical protein